MRLDPEIAALRHDRTPQRRAQKAMVAACQAWRGAPAVAAVFGELESYGQDASLAECPALAALFAEGEGALRFIEGLAGNLCETLAREHLAHPPFRHGFERGVGTLLIARSGRAHLLLHAREPGSCSFTSATFHDAERHEAILAGEGEGLMVRLSGESGTIEQTSLSLRPGVRLSLELPKVALHIVDVGRRLVALRLHRVAPSPAPSRQLALASGALLHLAAGDMRTSRQEAMIALLGRLDRADAAPLLAEIAREPGDASLRWQALREALVLDSAIGFLALGDLARRRNDPLAAVAASLHAELLVSHPQLAALDPCPA